MGSICSKLQVKVEEDEHPAGGGCDDLVTVDRGLVSTSKEGKGKVSEVPFLGKFVKGKQDKGKPDLSSHNGVSRAANSRGNKISILAFEVANTVGKAANLMQALSHKSFQFLKSVILNWPGVRQLVSQDTMDLLWIVAADQREEFLIFSAEVARFGNLCKNPQWHNLDRYFQKLETHCPLREKLQRDATTTIQELTILAQHTCELYHEFNAYDRIQQEYRRKLQEEESMPSFLQGEGMAIYGSEIKHQQKIIKSLKKKSLWSRNLHEVVEQLVGVVSYLHIAILESFNLNGTHITNYQLIQTPQRLGTCGLALHYANIIKQITSIVSRPLSFNQNMRDAFYHGLPTTIKVALRSRLQMLNFKGELSSVQIKAEIHKILQWLSPLAESTVKAHQDFGWVGEFANVGIELNDTPIYTRKITRIQTLYHADKERTEEYILQLVAWLHHLVKQVEHGYDSNTTKNIKYLLSKEQSIPLQIKVPPQSPPINGKFIQFWISPEERVMLEHTSNNRIILQRSRSLSSIGEKERGKMKQSSNKGNAHSSMDLSSICNSKLKGKHHLNSLHGSDTFD